MICGCQTPQKRPLTKNFHQLYVHKDTQEIFDNSICILQYIHWRCVRIGIRRSQVRIPPRYEVSGTLYISMLTIVCDSICIVEVEKRKKNIFRKVYLNSHVRIGRKTGSTRPAINAATDAKKITLSGTDVMI
jgi:hypothetical protein